jgi:hypothetical protein
MPNHWLLRIGNGNHFHNSSSKCIWGIESKQTFSKSFIKKVTIGDYLWFVKGKSRGKLIAVATFTGMHERIIGPIIDITFSNKELGWTETDGDWDTEIHYTNLYDIDSHELYSEIKGACTIRPYNEKCKVDLTIIYDQIMVLF